jgi:hypothetical protein
MDYQILINLGGGAALATIGWFARQLWDAVQELKKELSNLREDIAKNYVPKDDFKDAMTELRTMFHIISDKLDKKADK